MLRQLLAEFLGTALLVATVVGSGIMADDLAGGNDAIALLGNTLATGAILYVLISIFGGVSGAHFNAAVTLAMWMRGRIGALQGARFVVAQVAGALAGAVLAHAMFEMPLVEWSETTRSGTGQWLAEGVATFGLVTTIFGALRFTPNAVPTAVALFITAGYWFTASTSFANPAVTLGRTITPTFSGIAPGDAPAFVLVQLVAAALAALLAAWMFAEEESP